MANPAEPFRPAGVRVIAVTGGRLKEAQWRADAALPRAPSRPSFAATTRATSTRLSVDIRR